MVSFVEMLSPYFKSIEGSDYGKKSIDFSFQNWNVIEFSSPLLLNPGALRNLLNCIHISTSC